MMFEEFLLALMVVALALGYGACAALVVRNCRVADALFIWALGAGGSMLLASLGSACASVCDSARAPDIHPPFVSKETRHA